MVIASLDISTPLSFLLADLTQYIASVIIVFFVFFSFQSSQGNSNDRVEADQDRILALTHEITQLRAELQASQSQHGDLNASHQALQAQFAEGLALHEIVQTQRDDIMHRYETLEFELADTLNTLDLRDSQVDDLRTERNHLQTENRTMAEEYNRLRDIHTITNRRLRRSQALLQNLRDNFPQNADAMVSTPYQIDGIVLTKDGRPDLRYKKGKPFCHFSNENSSVLHNGRRMYIMLTTVSE